ncbi:MULTISPECIES: transglycosylase domain-containing protein [unclassified Bacillus (in: firmicutes)]|uniref:transglycosylase domain-containing protein n=1 Tax=unclassified Bacillus (in: firmicutes) TaxID=185979 RepID=UPI0008F08D8D|nr:MULTISPECIES: transglycosylase domain-containing protein [unclassified Bacillus (in: firmicutes)]SFB12964.1 penicillin-binding protein 1A [Bacillus sp. UNCCL13]SFQ90150.1 penicillin-binding protein 1A [Bacillus sp. cl95]
MKNVRTTFGFMMTFALLPFFALLVSLTAVQAGQVKDIHEFLDEEVKLDTFELSQTSLIFDHKDQIVTELSLPENRINLDSEEIPEFIKNLFIISEDHQFYEHPGFDLVSMGRALSINLQNQQIDQGASTITQQLVRNLYLNHERTYNRKLSEVLYAYQLERSLSKEKILELYINAIYFQNGAYGVEAASQTYFQKSVNSLSRAEQAFLCAIPNNPSLYDPLKNFEATKTRQERLIDQLQNEGYVSPEESTAMKSEYIQLNPKQKRDLFPEYTTYAEAELKMLISEKEGFHDQLLISTSDEQKQKVLRNLDKRYKEVLASGIKIYTALEPDVQVKASDALRKHLNDDGIQGSSAVIRQQRHQLIALTAGKDYHKYDFHRGYQAYRQPGSAIKPLLVYAPYIERTHADLSKRISGAAFCKNGFCPENYGHSTYGNVTIENAFIHSYNTPAVRMLNEIGVEAGFTDLEKFNFKKVTEADYGLSAAIGGFTTGMTPLEMASAYTTFGNNGQYQPARAIRKVTNLKGELLYEWNDKPIKIWSDTTNVKMRTLLSKTIQSGTAKKAAVPHPYAGGKTGTTNDYKDFWFVGLTDQLTASVWVGKDRPENMKPIESKAPHLLIWRDIVR